MSNIQLNFLIQVFSIMIILAILAFLLVSEAILVSGAILVNMVISAIPVIKCIPLILFTGIVLNEVWDACLKGHAMVQDIIQAYKCGLVICCGCKCVGEGNPWHQEQFKRHTEFIILLNYIYLVSYLTCDN